MRHRLHGFTRIGLTLTLAALTGCALNPITKTTTVTPGGIDASGVAYGPVTNITTTVNLAILDGELTAAELVETPLLTIMLQNHPEIRPVLNDLQTALLGWTSSGTLDTNVVAKVNGLVAANDPAVQAQILPLIQASKALQVRLLAKYGDKAAVIIIQGLLAKDLRVINAVLLAVPAPVAGK
jgi:hypothetical protein